MVAIDRKSHDESPRERPQEPDIIVGPGLSSGNRQFGQFLGSLREHAGLTRANAAAALGVSAEYLRLIEIGKRTPALGQMPSFLDAYHADGEVRRLQPGGDTPDLIVLDPYSGDPLKVEFKSRIREARRSSTSSPSDVTDRKKNPGFQNPIHEYLSVSRATELGFVVSLLARADDSILRKVHDLLLAKIGNGADAEA